MRLTEIRAFCGNFLVPLQQYACAMADDVYCHCASVDMEEPMFPMALFRSGLTLDWDLKGAIVYRIWQMTLAIACEMSTCKDCY